MKKDKIYSLTNNYIFDYLTRFSRKNLYLIVKNGKVVIENEGYNLCRKLKEENKLKDFTTKDLNNVVRKIYKYIIKNKEELISKYGNRGRYFEIIKKCKTLKQKQKISALTSAKINSQKKEDLTIKTIKNLLETTEKITIKVICDSSNISRETVIKYYQNFKSDIKTHNAKISKSR